MTNEEVKNITLESLRDWFKKEKWVRISSSGKIAGKCGTSKNKKNPDRCLPKAKAQSLTKGQRAATAAKKKKAGSKGKTVVKNTKKATVKKENTKLAEVAVPSTVPSNIMYHLNTKKGISGDYFYHIGTLLQALHRGSTMMDMDIEEKFYLHTVKFNPNVTIFPKVVNEDPEEGYDDDFDIDDVAETDVVIYDNGVEGLDYPEPLPDGCKTANQDPNYSIYAHSRNFKVVKVEELSTGWNGDDYNDKTNQHSRALYAACQLEYIPDVDETKKAKMKRETKKTTVKKEGLWANINAKKKAGKKSSHGNSNAYKDAKKAGDALEKTKEGITKEDIKNLVVGTLAEMQQNENLLQEDDRCTRLAKSKYDTWPSAYASGAVVRCRRGEIWKKK